MATSGNIYGTAVKEWQLRIDWRRSEYSITGNYSVVIADLYVYNRWYSHNNNANQAYYKIDGTQTFATYNFPNNAEWHYLGSKTITIYHEANGTKTYGLTGQWHSGLNTNYTPADLYVSGNITLDTIPRQATITKANDFNDEQNPYMEFANPANFKVNLVLEFAGTSIRRDGITGSGGYTFELTEAERKLLRQKVTSNDNKLTVRYVVATLVDGVNESLWDWTKPDKTMTLINANPEFNNFTFKDINSKTIALTSSNQNIIKGYSNVQVTIPVASKAIAKKETTMKLYRFVCGDVSNDLEYKDNASVIGGIYNIPNGTFTVYATDSRNNSTPVTKLANKIIEYKPLAKGNIDVYRDGGVSETVKLQLDGTIDLVNFGKKTNAIKKAKLRYAVANTDDWSDPQDIVLTITDGKFSYNGAITGDLESKGFNISNSYQVEVIVEDELSSVTFTDTFGSGVPNIAYHKNGVSVMGKYDVDEGGLFQVEGKNVIQKHIITAWPTVEHNLNANLKEITLGNSISVGTKLTLENGRIKIGAGVSKVKISATVFIEDAVTNSYIWTFITRERSGSLENIAGSIFTTTRYFDTPSISDCIIDVKEGDAFLLRADNPAYSSSSVIPKTRAWRTQTWLTVEVIE